MAAEPRPVSDLVRELSIRRRARAAYTAFAASIEDEVNKRTGYTSLSNRVDRHKADIARRAADAEFNNLDPVERPTSLCGACPPTKCDQCSACVNRILDVFK